MTVFSSSLPRAAKWGLALAVAVAAYAGWRHLGCAGCAAPAAGQAAGAEGRSWFDAKLGTGAAPALAASAARDPASLRRMLQTTGSLRDSEVDGAWPVDGQGKLVPSILVRRRFEYFIAASGEVTDAEIRALIEDDAKRELKPQTVAEAMGLLQRYLEARAEVAKYKVDTRDPDTMRAALTGLHAARERILGPDWARAFYGEEEAYFETQVQRVELAHSGEAGAAKAAREQSGDTALLLPDGKDQVALRDARTKAYGSEATARMEQVDAQWAQWNARIAKARQEVARIRGNAALSDVQKKAEVMAYIEANFSAGSERLRAQGLLEAY